MKISFSKYQATGNDFILIDGIKYDISLNNTQIKQLCDRNFGVGSDGLIIVRSSDKAQFFMDFYNPDGTKAEMCGNGIRCLASFVIDSELVHGVQHPAISVETRAGVKTVKTEGKLYSVDMGKPLFSNDDIGFKANEPMWKYNLDVENQQIEIYGVSIGNPHCIILSSDLEAEPIEELGPLIENHTLFKNRINVEWVSVKSDSKLQVKVWERGAGFTLACGTGACASFAVANRLGLVGDKATVSLPGGKVKVELQNNSLVLKGEAKKVFEGHISNKWLDYQAEERY